MDVDWDMVACPPSPHKHFSHFQNWLDQLHESAGTHRMRKEAAFFAKAAPLVPEELEHMHSSGLPEPPTHWEEAQDLTYSA